MKKQKIAKKQKTFKRVVNPTMAKIGERIRIARQDQKLTITELAKKLKTSGSSLGQIENGWRTPSAAYLDKIAKALGTDSVFLVTGTPQRVIRQVVKAQNAWEALHKRS